MNAILYLANLYLEEHNDDPVSSETGALGVLINAATCAECMEPLVEDIDSFIDECGISVLDFEGGLRAALAEHRCGAEGAGEENI
jgi:hypothetical protein